jgi:hypothetical protein
VEFLSGHRVRLRFPPTGSEALNRTCLPARTLSKTRVRPLLRDAPNLKGPIPNDAESLVLARITAPPFLRP